MNSHANFLDLIQAQIEVQKAGILVSIKLLNEDELKLLTEDTTSILNDFHQLVRDVCYEQKVMTLITSLGGTRLYFIMPDEPERLEKIAFLIHMATQSYINEKLPEVYFKTSVGSIKFIHNKKTTARYLVSMLKYAILGSNDKTGYYNYDAEAIDIDILREKNINMNWLRKCLLERKTKFMYQPIVDRESGKISYYECLLRVPTANNKLVSVGPMIEDAENKGLIQLVDLVVLEMAIEELVNDPELSISMNISNIGVLNKYFHKKALELLSKHDVGKRLIIEITETSLNQDFVRTKHFMNSLHKFGCRFALDDFGSGFTSLKQLLHLPIDIIKIDGSYIRDILENDRNRFFVEALIKLAENLGLKTVAEFVENGAIAKYLIDVKIGGMQGNFFLPASTTRVNLD